MQWRTNLDSASTRFLYLASAVGASATGFPTNLDSVITPSVLFYMTPLTFFFNFDQHYLINQLVK